MAFKVYHAMKIDYKGIVEESLQTDNFDIVWMKCIELLNHFKKEHPIPRL